MLAQHWPADYAGVLLLDFGMPMSITKRAEVRLEAGSTPGSDNAEEGHGLVAWPLPPIEDLLTFSYVV